MSAEQDLSESSHGVVEIRPGTLAEIGTLAVVMERAYARRDNLPLPSSAQERSETVIRTNIATENSWSLVALSDGRPTGFVIGYPLQPLDTFESDSMQSKTEYLSLLMVDPDFWGRGIASRLLTIIEGRMRGAARDSITLWTRQANNNRSQSFYERRHYRSTGITKEDEFYGPQCQYKLDL